MKKNESKVEQTSEHLPDYNTYDMSFKERVLYILIAAVFLFATGYIFYHSFIIAGVITPLAIFYPFARKKEIINRRKEELNLQFKDMIYAVSSSLSAGKSVEMAFKALVNDLSIEYPDKTTFIVKEAEYIIRKIELNESLESALQDFADRSHLDDVQNFVDVFSTCKKMGGNIVEIIKNSTDIINDKIEIKNEIDTLLSARKFEQKVLNLMPIALVLVMSLMAKDYVAPIYNTVIGRVVTTLAIGFLIVAYLVSKKVVNIKV